MAGFRSLLVLLLVFPSGCVGFRSPLSVFKRFKETTRSFSNECLGTTRPVIPIDSSDFALDIRMPGVTPKQSDTYFCMSVRLPMDEEAFVIDFKPRASMDTVHHMLLFGCNMPASTGNYWFCDEGTCTVKPIFSMPGQEMLPQRDSPKVLDSELEERLEANTLYSKYTMGILVLLEIITRTALVFPYTSHACHSL